MSNRRFRNTYLDAESCGNLVCGNMIECANKRSRRIQNYIDQNGKNWVEAVKIIMAILGGQGLWIAPFAFFSAGKSWGELGFGLAMLLAAGYCATAIAGLAIVPFCALGMLIGLGVVTLILGVMFTILALCDNDWATGAKVEDQ